MGGEKIVGMHYADDAIITIKQNKCFKVIKDLTAFERASGAKVNYEKTKGLWCGAWKNRTDIQLNIKWTSENVENWVSILVMIIPLPQHLRKFSLKSLAR